MTSSTPMAASPTRAGTTCWGQLGSLIAGWPARGRSGPEGRKVNAPPHVTAPAVFPPASGLSAISDSQGAARRPCGANLPRACAQLAGTAGARPGNPAKLPRESGTLRSSAGRDMLPRRQGMERTHRAGQRAYLDQAQPGRDRAGRVRAVGGGGQEDGRPGFPGAGHFLLDAADGADRATHRDLPGTRDEPPAGQAAWCELVHDRQREHEARTRAPDVSDPDLDPEGKPPVDRKSV